MTQHALASVGVVGQVRLESFRVPAFTKGFKLPHNAHLGEEKVRDDSMEFSDMGLSEIVC